MVIFPIIIGGLSPTIGENSPIIGRWGAVFGLIKFTAYKTFVTVQRDWHKARITLDLCDLMRNDTKIIL
jgi:hypothetical protein